MSEDGDSWLKAAFGLDVEQVVLPQTSTQNSFAGAIPLFGEIATATGAAVTEAAPLVGAGAAVGGVAGGMLVVGGVVVGAAAPIVLSHIFEHAEELDKQTDPDERSLPGGAPPIVEPDGGVLGPPTVVPQGDPDVPLPDRPTEIPKGPGFDPTIQPPGPAPDFAPGEPTPFEDPFNPRFPRPPRLPEFPPEQQLEAPQAPPETPSEPAPED